MSIYALISLLATIFTFGVGAIVYLNSSKGRLPGLFFLFSISISLLNFSQFHMRIADTAEYALLWSKVTAIWPITLILAIHFITELNKKKYRKPYFYFALYLPGLVISYLHFSTNLFASGLAENYWGWSIVYSQSKLYYIIFSIAVIYWIISISYLYYYYHHFTGKAKKQVLFIFLAQLFSLVITALSDGLSAFLPINVPELGSIADPITVTIMAYAIWKYDIFNLKDDVLSNKLFSSINNNLLLVDGKRNIIEINTKLLETLGYTHDEIIGTKIDRILPFNKIQINPISKHIAYNSIFENKNLVFINKDGEGISLLFSASFVKLKNSLKPGLIYVGNNVSSIDDLHEVTNYKEETKFLAEAALDLVKLDNIDDINHYIASKIYSLLNKKAIVIATEVREAPNQFEWKIKAIKGVNDYLKKLTGLINIDIDNLSGTAKSNYISHLEQGKMSPLDLDISKFTSGVIPNSISDKFKSSFDIRQLNIIPLFHNKRISGAICIITSKKSPEINPEIIESFAAISSLVIRRKYYENELASLNNMQSKLFSVIGHDIQSPISTIISSSDMILDDYGQFDKETLKQFFESINRSANSGFDILNSLLLWSKSIQGGLSLKQEELDLGEISIAALEHIKNQAESKNIDVRISIKRNQLISADRNMMITVLRNLLTNAVKFTDVNGEIKIHSTTDTHRIKLSVTDNGIGMNQVQLKSLFKIGNLPTKNGTKGEKGSGFGLLICKEFIEKNGGQLEVISQENNGSEFSIVFPTIKKMN